METCGPDSAGELSLLVLESVSPAPPAEASTGHAGRRQLGSRTRGVEWPGPNACAGGPPRDCSGGQAAQPSGGSEDLTQETVTFRCSGGHMRHGWGPRLVAPRPGEVGGRLWKTHEGPE